MKKFFAILIFASCVSVYAQTSSCGETSQSGTDSGNALWQLGTPCATGTNANGYAVSSISYWVGSPTSTSFDLGVYSNSSGTPNSLLCSVSTGTITPSSGWNTVNISGCPTLSASTTYWLGYVTGSGTIEQGTVTGACPGTSYYSTWTNSALSGVSLANPFPANTPDTHCYSMYMTLTADSAPPAATPTFSPAAGTYASAQSVTISDSTSGATIYYTTNGTTPSTSSSVYSSPITVASTETLEAMATATGYSQSAVGSAAYTITSSGAQVTASGTTTANTVPVFSSSSAITNSPLAVSGSNVGIGTTTPSAPLEVSGASGTSQNNIATFDNSTNGAYSSMTSAGSASSVGTWTNGSQIMEFVPYASGNGIVSSYTGSLQFQTNARTNQMTITSGGNVGIGTTSPSKTLQLGTEGNGGTNQISIPGTYNFENIYLGQIGNGDDALEFVNHASVSNSSGVKLLSSIDSGVSGLQIAVAPSAASYGALSYTTAMTVTTTGNIGIGTTAPTYNLDVAGVARAQQGVIYPDGNKQTIAWTGVLCGGDYAEAVNASGNHKSYEPGDVLVLASNANGNVEKSGEPYSTMVAGIFATKPGVIGRRETLVKSADEIPMAMVGIVPTKVSAENGPIRQGDLLVTSSTTGYAMKGTDRGRMLGAVIGKAMGSLESGTGVIEVLVTLQ
jgi:hypothetical protein